jgi:hypothetical protein
MGQTQVVKTIGGKTIKPTDRRIKVTGSLSVSLEEFPDPGAEVTITLHGFVEGHHLDHGGPAKKKGWTETANLVPDRIISIEARVPEKDPELPLEDGTVSLDDKRAGKS